MKAKRGLWRAPTAIGTIAPGAVDRENRIIRGFAVVEAGEARTHERIIDGTTLDKVVELGNGLASGVKMRFGHPQMSDDALGKFAGRAKNFRRDGQRVLADAHFDPSAFIQSPQMAEHIFVRAESDAASFGTSLDLKMTLEKRLNSDGTPQKDREGNDLLPLVRPTELFGSDFVDSPAATTALFSGTNVVLSEEATQILDTVLARPDAAEKLNTFLDRYLQNRKEASMPDEPDATAPANAAQTLYQKLGERLGFGATAPASVAVAQLPSPEPALPAPEVADEAPVSTSLDTVVSAQAAQLSAQAAQLTSTNEQMARMMALMQAQTVDRQTADMASFAARIDALVPVTSLSLTAAADFKKSVEALLPTSLTSAEEVVAGLEGLPRVYEQVSLSEEVTFTAGGAQTTTEVDLRSYGVVQDANGDFVPGDAPAALLLATEQAGKGLDRAAEMRMLRKAFRDNGGKW